MCTTSGSAVAASGQSQRIAARTGRFTATFYRATSAKRKRMTAGDLPAASLVAVAELTETLGLGGLAGGHVLDLGHLDAHVAFA